MRNDPWNLVKLKRQKARKLAGGHKFVNLNNWKDMEMKKLAKLASTIEYKYTRGRFPRTSKALVRFYIKWSK